MFFGLMTQNSKFLRQCFRQILPQNIKNLKSSMFLADCVPCKVNLKKKKKTPSAFQNIFIHLENSKNQKITF